MLTVPVNVGEAKGAFKFKAVVISVLFAFKSNADCVATETGLLASVVLSTLPKPISDLVMITLPLYPFTVCTGGAGVNNSIQFASTEGLDCAKT
jgi:hypothetical protein